MEQEGGKGIFRQWRDATKQELGMVWGLRGRGRGGGEQNKRQRDTKEEKCT